MLSGENMTGLLGTLALGGLAYRTTNLRLLNGLNRKYTKKNERFRFIHVYSAFLRMPSCKARALYLSLRSFTACSASS
eukprot:1375771-Amorphochlora_amoeboformis.AAC.2